MTNKIPVIAVYDVGKTNKKIFLINSQYQIVWEQSIQLSETTDDDGFACEDVAALSRWIKTSFNDLQAHNEFEIVTVNFSAYGASFVYLGADLQPILPLYNYLKPYPETLLNNFYNTYGGKEKLAKETASPVLANLNSGMQLYWLKNEKPGAFSRIKYALHLPQYLSFLLGGVPCTDITSVGCHTNLWNFEKQEYHEWVIAENIDEKFAPFTACTELVGKYNTISVGTGLHDSSAALIPYLASFHEPFILLSTGTWCISINPFNQQPLTTSELQQDCLCFLSYQDAPVKASRLFAGYEHEQEIKRLAEHFNKPLNYYKTVTYKESLLHNTTNAWAADAAEGSAMVKASNFKGKTLAGFSSYEEAYHQLIADLVAQQIYSTGLVLNGSPVKRIFVDGGFSKNAIYMHLLADAFIDIEVYAASVAQASAIGAALAVHKHWNSLPLPSDIITLKYYAASKQVGAR